MTLPSTWIDQDEVQEILTPYHSDLRACVEGGWDKWVKEIRPSFPSPTNRLRANAIWEGMVDEARVRFSDLPYVSIIDRGDCFFLTFDGRLLLRFKMLDKKLRTRNYPTQHAVTLDAQMNLPSVPDGSMVTVGYRVDEDTLALKDVLVVMSRSNKALWSYEWERSEFGIVVPLRSTQGTLPIPGVQAPLGGANRFRSPERAKEGSEPSE